MRAGRVEVGVINDRDMLMDAFHVEWGWLYVLKTRESETRVLN